MKLSEAILLGSVGSEQGYGNTSMFRESKAKCALGAALHAVGQARHVCNTQYGMPAVPSCKLSTT
jgi:hypothetical protein